jgi:hypothetical protein
MAWIKRNLYFVITVVVALGVTGYCGYLLFTVLNENSEVADKYNGSKSSLDGLLHQTPFPSPENIKSAEADAARVRNFLADFRKPFAPFPTPPKEDVQGFNTYLTKIIAQFGAEATNAGVGLDPGYAFSFSQQVGKLNHPIEAIGPWMVQMEEIRAILHILYAAKINYLEKIKRVSISQDDMGADDYIQFTNTTTSWGSISPYMVTFRGFSAEIANVLAGIASSSNCFIVKAIYVQPSRVPLPPPPADQPTAPPPTERQFQFRPPPSSDQFQNPRRPGRGEGSESFRFRPPPQIAPTAVAPVVPAGPEIIEFEKPLFVTIYLDVVKLKPAEKPVAPAGAAGPSGESPRPGRRGRP